MRYKPWKLATTGGLITLAAIVGFGGPAAVTQAVAPPAGPVLTTPVTLIPHLLSTGSDQIRQIVQCGTMMYAVGTFSTIKRQSLTYTRNNVFSFSATKPYTVSSWAPAVNGTVNSITFNGTNCANAYIGGKFTAIGATTAKNIAEVNTSTGAVVTSWAHSASAKVETMANYQGHILVGGYFTSIANDGGVNPYLASLSATTGKDDGFISLNISGNYNFPGVSSNPTEVYNQSISHGGTLDLVMGDFTSVGGQARQQIFMLDLTTSPATVTPWTSPQWDGSQGEATPHNPTGYPYQCSTIEPFYIQAAAWSPDDTTIDIATTGYHPNNWPTGQTPRNGLCDAVASFPATQGTVLSNWINYTGCDSLFSVAADSGAVYAGGHERWSQNSNDCDEQGPGALAAPGMEGVDPATGLLLLNSSGTSLYTRGRGLGADDMLITSAGLWIASDNSDGTQQCNGVNGLAGLCLLPYPTG